MTKTLEGVRDPIRVSAECENAVVEGWPYKGPEWDTVYDVDADGYLRDDDGNPVPWVGPSVVATDVDPETWGDHYHHPADCPEKDLPTHRPNRTTCDDCTVAVEREHDRDHYRPEPDPDAEVSLADIRAVLADVPDESPRKMFVSDGMAEALRREYEAN